MPKKPPPRKRYTTWKAYQLGAKLRLLGFVVGDTEEEAIERAVSQFKVREDLRDRLIVRREE